MRKETRASFGTHRRLFDIFHEGRSRVRDRDTDGIHHAVLPGMRQYSADSTDTADLMRRRMRGLLEEFLSEKPDARSGSTPPERGEMNDLLKMANTECAGDDGKKDT